MRESKHKNEFKDVQWTAVDYDERPVHGFRILRTVMSIRNNKNQNVLFFASIILVLYSTRVVHIYICIIYIK